MVSSILLNLGINNLYDMIWTKIDQKIHDIGVRATLHLDKATRNSEQESKGNE